MIRNPVLLTASTTKRKSLVISTGNFGTPFFVQIVAGAEAPAMEMGGSNVTVRPFQFSSGPGLMGKSLPMAIQILLHELDKLGIVSISDIDAHCRGWQCPCRSEYCSWSNEYAFFGGTPCQINLIEIRW
jgi:hypothetical protein